MAEAGRRRRLTLPPPLSRFLFLFAAWDLLCSGRRLAALKVTSTGPPTVLAAEGGGAILACGFGAGLADAGRLDVEWTAGGGGGEERLLLSYSGGVTYHHGGGGAAAEGLSFSAGDPSAGDASLAIAALTPAHGATYRCRVKKPPGVDARKVTLVVMAKPSTPRCWLEGAELEGGAVSLRCHAEAGAAPLTYAWRRESGDLQPDAAAQDHVTGELRISNHSQAWAGLYVCEVRNAVGNERCTLILRAGKPPSVAAVTVDTATGSILLAFVLLVFGVLVYWRLERKFCWGEELANDIRMDATPPARRRRSSQRPPVVVVDDGALVREATTLEQLI